jgi:hypothetical protein
MSNRRIRKKWAKEEEAHAADRMALHSAVLELACPWCGQPELVRTFIPRLGSMHGSVACSRCPYEEPYLQRLAVEMKPSDPLPPAILDPPRRARASTLELAEGLLPARRSVLAPIAAWVARWREVPARLAHSLTH